MSQKINQEQAEEIRLRYAQGEGVRALAKRFGITPKNIRRILAQEQWKTKGERFEYEEDRWEEDF